MTRERTWFDLSRQEKLTLLGEALTPAERGPVVARVEKFFRGRSMDDLLYATNVVMREAWREEHGDTAEWDRRAADVGVVIR